MSKKSILSGISRNVIVLGCISLLTDLSSQMVFPLIPLFLGSVLDAGASAVGLVEGAAETTASLLKVVTGYVSDRMRKRRLFILLGYGFSAINKPLFAFANGWLFVFFVRVIERIGKGVRNAPRDAIISESCERPDIGKAFGFQRMMDGLGSMLGAIAAYVLLRFFGLDFRTIFLIAFIPGVFSVASVFFVKDTEPQPHPDRKKRASLTLSIRSLPRDLKIFLVVTALFSFGHFGYAFLLLKAKEIGMNDSSAVLLYVLFYTVYTIFSTPAGALSDRIGRGPVLKAGYLLFAFVCLGVIACGGRAALAAFFVIYGIFFALVDGVQRAYVSDLAPAELKATALGAFHTAVGLSALPGGFVAGLLWDKVDPVATFAFGAVLSVIAFLFFSMIRTPRPVSAQ